MACLPATDLDEIRKQKARDRARQWRIDHPERFKAAQKAYGEKNRERRSVYGKEYYEKHRGDRARRVRRSPEQLREAARVRAKEWYANNRERALANVKKYCGRNSEKISDQRKSFRETNADRLRLKHRSYYALNPEMYKERSRIYRRNNPEAVRAWGRNRRAREVGAEGRHTQQELMELMLAQRHKCAYCRADIRDQYHADHIVPLVRGGTNWIQNIQLLCPTCNLKKNARHPVEFAQSIGLLV